MANIKISRCIRPKCRDARIRDPPGDEHFNHLQKRRVYTCQNESYIVMGDMGVRDYFSRMFYLNLRGTAAFNQTIYYRVSRIEAVVILLCVVFYEVHSVRKIVRKNTLEAISN